MRTSSFSKVPGRKIKLFVKKLSLFLLGLERQEIFQRW